MELSFSKIVIIILLLVMLAIMIALMLMGREPSHVIIRNLTNASNTSVEGWLYG